MHGPYKTTSSRDNVPHDNKWNGHLVNETAQLLAHTLRRMPDLKLAGVGLLQAMPLLRQHELPENWMFRPVYETVIETLKDFPLIPAADEKLISATRARFARGKGLTELFTSAQLSLLLHADQGVTLDWISADISETRPETSSLFHFLRQVMDIDQIEPEDLANYLDADFFVAQRISWMVKFYTFLLDQERLWRRDSARANLLRVPFVRLQDNTHVVPFKSDGVPNVYLPGETETDFDTVHRLLAKPKKCSHFLRKLGLTEPDITSEVLQKVIPQYEPNETRIPERKHLANLKKIFRALSGDSKNRSILVQRLKDLSFLFCVQPGSKRRYRGKANALYFRTRQVEEFFENEKSVWFLDEPQALVSQDKIKGLLSELGVEDKPRRILVEPEDRWANQRKLREGYGYSWDVHYYDYDIQGLGSFLKIFKKVDLSEATRRARLIWDFLITHLENCAPGSEKSFFEGEYEWSYYSRYSKKFDALFLNRLRAKEWLPGPDGQLHKPSELLPQELPPSFTRNPVLCEALQMKAEVLVNLAKEAGFKVEDLMLIRRHKEEFEKFKRTLKEKPVPNAMPVESPTQAHPVTSELAERADFSQDNRVPTGTSPQVPEQTPPPLQSPFSENAIRDAVEALLGPNSAPSTSLPGELNTCETPAGSLPGRNGTPIGSSPRTHRGHSQSGKYFTFVYTLPEENGSLGGSNGIDSAEIDRREKVGRGGIDAALEFERKSGRNPIEMDHLHEGYDVESRSTTGEIERYIEVKAISADWGDRGVTLSQAQFTTAQELKEHYWLYVVENPSTPAELIYRIQNPATQVKSFAYDKGWKTVAEAEISV
jgi:hypothetical protein